MEEFPECGIGITFLDSTEHCNDELKPFELLRTTTLNMHASVSYKFLFDVYGNFSWTFKGGVVVLIDHAKICPRSLPASRSIALSLQWLFFCFYFTI